MMNDVKICNSIEFLIDAQGLGSSTASNQTLFSITFSPVVGRMKLYFVSEIQWESCQRLRPKEAVSNERSDPPRSNSTHHQQWINQGNLRCKSLRETTSSAHFSYLIVGLKELICWPKKSCRYVQGASILSQLMIEDLSGKNLWDQC